MSTNVVTADFKGEWSCVTEPLWQWDYGQALKVTGIPDLPTGFEVHFANFAVGTAITSVAVDDRVAIPNQLLTTGYPIYGWIFVSTGSSDGETEYKVTIPVNRRAMPTWETPTPQEQSAITQAVAALNAAAVNVEAEYKALSGAVSDCIEVVVSADDWAVGGINQNNGDNANSPYTIRTVRKKPISPGAVVVFTGVTKQDNISRLAYAYYYDKTGAFISRGLYNSIPSNAAYVRYTYGWSSTAGETVESYGMANLIADWSISCSSEIRSDLSAANGKISGLKTAVSELTEDYSKSTGRIKDLTGQYAFTTPGRINYSNGEMQTSSASAGNHRSASDYVDVSEYDYLKITMVMGSASVSHGIAFYNAQKVYISGIKELYASSLEALTYHIRLLTIPDNAVYVRTTWFASTDSDYDKFVCNAVRRSESLLPEYYFEDDYLPDRITTIQEHRKTMGLRADEFCFFTDPHFLAGNTSVVENGLNGVGIMKYVADNANITKAVCGGDLLNGSGMTIDNCVDMFQWVRNYLAPIWPNLYMVIGNHEWNNPSAQHTEEAEANQAVIQQIYNQWVRDKEKQFGGAHLMSGTYYIDNAITQVRTVYLACTYGGNLTEDQILWMADVLENTPSGYALVVVSHISLTAEGEYIGRFQNVADMLDALKSKSTYTYTRESDPSWTRSFDYSGTNVTVCGVISGHIHLDIGVYTDGGVPIICTVCDRGPRSTSSVAYMAAREYGTIKEQAIDVVQIDIDNGKIYTTRIGGSYYSGAPLENPDREYEF